MFVAVAGFFEKISIYMGTRVIHLQDIYVQMAKIKDALHLKLTHPYLAKYIPSPVIDEDKLLLFYALFDQIDLPDEKKENYIITAMLVQIALDTHDEVSTSVHLKQEEFMQRQLIVLAGDYFSALYYALLSEMQDIGMIRTLATAIKEINEHKIRLYEETVSDFDSFVASIIKVETALFQHVSDYFQAGLFSKLTTKFLSYKRLTLEKNRYSAESLSIMKNLEKKKKNIGTIEFTGVYLKEFCNRYFEETADLLESCFQQPSSLQKVLLARLQSFKYNQDIRYTTLAEEGL